MDSISLDSTTPWTATPRQHHPPGQHHPPWTAPPSWTAPSPWTAPPPGQHHHPQTAPTHWTAPPTFLVNKWVIRIRLECFLVSLAFVFLQGAGWNGYPWTHVLSGWGSGYLWSQVPFGGVGVSRGWVCLKGVSMSRGVNVRGWVPTPATDT